MEFKYYMNIVKKCLIYQIKGDKIEIEKKELIQEKEKNWRWWRRWGFQ